MLNFEGECFGHCDLKDTNLCHTNLRHADLSVVQNLTIDHVAGTDLTNTILPADFPGYDNLDYLKSAITRAVGLFNWNLLFYTFCLFTVFSVSDVGLIVRQDLGKVPYIDMATSVSLFFKAAPLIILLSYIYFHKCLTRIWQEISRLPAYFQDGTSVRT